MRFPRCHLILAHLAVLGGLALPTAFAQPLYEVHPNYTFRHWTVQDGLPSNTINDFLQTSDGYLWLTTIEGVVRFDGQQFTVYNATNTPSLTSNRVFQLVEGPPGHLWIGSEPNGLTLYHEGVFTRVEVEGDTPRDLQILLVEGDTVWVNTGEGLARYSEGRMRLYRRDVIQAEVTALVRDAASRLWVGTVEEGIYRLDPDGAVRHFGAEDGLPPVKVQNLLLDQEGRLWAALHGGLARIVGERVEVIPHPRGRWPVLTDMRYLDARGGVWVSSDAEGWWRFDPSGALTLIATSTSAKRPTAIMTGPDGRRWRVEDRAVPTTRGLDGLVFRDDEIIFGVTNNITNMIFDRRGGLWVGTGTEGLFRLQRAVLRTLSVAEGLPNGNIYPILEDRQGQIWVGTFGDGVIRLGDNPSGSILSPSGGYMLSLLEDQDGSIWVGKFGPTCRIQQDQCPLVDFPGLGRESEGIRAMYRDRQGRFWLGGNNGLAVGRGEGTQRTWTAVASDDGLPANPVRAIMETRDGAVLFGTNGDGLLRYDEDGGFEALTTDDGLASNNVRDFYEDHEGFLWIVLEDRGLCRLDRRGRLALKEADLACISTREGLHWDGLHRLLDDDQGRFWFNSNYGIFWVERAALQDYFAGTLAAVASVSYTEADGIRNREGNGGMQPAGIKARDGRLLFPTQDGVVIVDPEAVPTPAPPPVRLEAIRVGETVRPVADTLALRPQERDLQIHYTALEYVRPEDVRFQYRLDGYDDTWQDAGRQRQATYTNLPAGAYTFQVRAGLGRVWSEPAMLAIERLPFFWETAWFYTLAVLLIALAGTSAYRYRIRRLKAREALLEQTVTERTVALQKKTKELEQANSLKSRFLANISHEFRTPLTLTFGPLDDLLSGRFKVEEAARPHLERARRNGGRLLRLINQLLDLSKLDAGALVLHARRHDLAAHLRQLTALFDSIAETQGLQYSTRIPDEPLWHVYDADKIEKVIINLISNAFKFTPSGCKVAVALEQKPGEDVRIVVADTGSGIAEEHLPRLFDRFYQVEERSTRQHEGSGIGLALVKELVTLHGGTITVESTVGFGTRFTVRLPFVAVSEAVAAPAEPASPAPVRRAETQHNHDISGSLRVQPIPEPTAAAVPEEATVVLVVEDNADMRAYIRSHLEDAFIIVEAVNGRDGLDRAVDLVPDLVLSDVMMPEMDGLDLCQALKEDTRTSHIPVILLTAKAQVEHRIAGFESGADAYLPKPFNAEELLVRVRTLIEGRRQLRARLAGKPAPTEATVETEAEALPPREMAFLEDVEALIHSRLADTQFGADALAEALHMSPRQMHRKLRALLDESPGAMMRRLRLREAARLLQKGETSVKEAMYAVGFSSHSSFSRAFRQVYGQTPTEYMEQAQRP